MIQDGADGCFEDGADSSAWFVTKASHFEC